MTTTKTRRLRFAHASMQFSDNDRQQVADARTVMTRQYDIITGTEAGPASNLAQALRQEAKANGYRFYLPKRPTDAWVAVSRHLIEGGWETGYIPAIPGSGSLRGATRRWGPKGVVHVAFDTADLGRIHVSASHYLTGGRRPGRASQHGAVNHYDLNVRLAKAIGEWAQDAGQGTDLAFHGTDANTVDRTDDVFHGAPLTTAWDALGRYENTGHGNIDVIASYDKDRRVEWQSVRALDDSEVFMHTDHFLVEAVAEVRLLSAA